MTTASDHLDDVGQTYVIELANEFHRLIVDQPNNVSVRDRHGRCQPLRDVELRGMAMPLPVPTPLLIVSGYRRR